MTDSRNAHARLAPSSAHIWVLCPGSVAMQERQPPQEETDENREGTAAHWLLEQVLLKLTVPDDAIAPNGVPINDEMREAIQEIVRDVNDTLAHCLPGDFYQIEQRVNAHVMVHPDNDGTPDVYFVQRSRRTIHVWDFKYGHRFVDAYRCLQLVDYSAAIIETEMIADWQDWAFTFTIAQPRCYERDELGDSLREWITDGHTIAPIIDQLRQAAQEASQPDAPCRTGDHCLDCIAAFDCVANQRMVGAVMDFAYGQSSLAMDEQAVGLELTMLENAEARIIARRKAVENVAQAMMNQGRQVAHHGIGWSKPRWIWDKTKQAEAANLVAMFGVPVLPGVALPTPGECVKQGVDETVITPYTTKANPAQKVIRRDDTTAAKVFGSRR